MPVMVAISSIEPAAAPHHPGAEGRDQKHRPPVQFGAAVTNRDVVQEKLRVDPAALADRQRAPAAIRTDDEARRDRLREERLARQEESYRERKAPRGAIVDIEA